MTNLTADEERRLLLAAGWEYRASIDRWQAPSGGFRAERPDPAKDESVWSVLLDQVLKYRYRPDFEPPYALMGDHTGFWVRNCVFRSDGVPRPTVGEAACYGWLALQYDLERDKR